VSASLKNPSAQKFAKIAKKTLHQTINSLFKTKNMLLNL
jgi:hypothetical protein